MGGEGSGEIFLSLGIRGCSEIPTLVHTDSDAKLLIMTLLHVYERVCVRTHTSRGIHVSNSKSCLTPHPPYQILD